MNSIFDIVTSPTLWSVFGFLFAGLYLTYRITTPKTRIRRQEKLWLRRNYPVVILSGVALLAIVALTFYLVEIGISVRVLVDRLRATALDPASPHLPLLASQQRRWALWVDSDADAFRRAYRTLKILRRHPGPSRLLALHAPGLPRAGLLSNLQHGARRFLDIELVVLSP